MNLTELYETNADFRGYVDRYAKHNGISTEEALEHAMVRQYAEEGIKYETGHDRVD